ncbi:MAG: AAA family ATPase [Pseudomonadota bacterium]|nr:AAA family ATPase [Pseudomonadota bacterium]
MDNNQRHLISNAKNGNFNSAVQLFLNYRDGLNGFEKDEGQAFEAFTQATTILCSHIFLDKLHISNFKKIKNLKINLDKSLTVFIGENGVGKTSLLEAIRRNLMWIAATTRKDNTNGGRIEEDEINNDAKKKGLGAYIDCEFAVGSIRNTLRGRIARQTDASISNLKSELTNYRDLGRNLRYLNEYKDINLPLFAFYGIDRLQKGAKNNQKITFEKVDGYDSSLNYKTSFDIFYEWLVQLLKVSEPVVANSERQKIQSQIDILLKTGANNKEHPLYEVYEDLVSVIKIYPNQELNMKAQNTIESLERLFKSVYKGLTKIELINQDDGKDKIVIHLEEEIIFLDQFSDGQRVLFGLLGDIARRLILLNNVSENPLHGYGVILIDEIELHLHPMWQQQIVLILRKSFPNIQFIITTHSPHVITTVEPETIRSIYIDRYEIPSFTKGAQSNVVLKHVFNVDPRPQEVEEVQWLDQYIELVNQDKWDSDEAISLRQKLDAWGKNKETELDQIDIEISLRKFKRSKQ